MAQHNQLYIMLNQSGRRNHYAQIALSISDKLTHYDIWQLNPDIENVEFSANAFAIGSIHTARITQIDAKTRLAFLTLGAKDAVMQLTPKHVFTEGQYILAEVTKDAFDDKNPRTRFAGEVKQGEKHKPSLHKPALNLAQHCLNLAQKNNSEIITDDYAFYAAVKKQKSLDGSNVELAEVNNTKKQQMSLLEYANLADQIETLHTPQIQLDNGGNIIIEHTKAMTVVDVNSGSYTGANMNDDINQLAAQKLVEQLALRHIGGLIIVDFLKYKLKAERDGFGKYLRNLTQDYAIEMGTYTGFGLVELKIKRSGLRLDEKLLGMTHD